MLSPGTAFDTLSRVVVIVDVSVVEGAKEQDKHVSVIDVSVVEGTKEQDKHVSVIDVSVASAVVVVSSLETGHVVIVLVTT